MKPKPNVLFVCLGNICRSPLAEAAFRQAADRAGLQADADSAGTAAYHIGNPPDPRAIATAADNGANIKDYRGRQLEDRDFTRFTHIFALDENNLLGIKRKAPADATATIALLLDSVPGREGKAVADPYYGDQSDFEVTWSDVCEAADAFVKSLSKAADA